ncbi:hybrid sensor histidine kinase/response regulator [Arthrospira platensis]|jgi:two-component system chemotaxis sensor kinase CheA|uniref:histidine kinase n=1 Tax=Limnospira platensis NIES-46 TaxID=1236695 RepID=A0A5M3T6S7_LIMPL|nr:hybrid sensor histidine kinase/response regulator [Arthrospira platensis]KDR55995.1 chemotaxis protein CheA [Arthrospira platensis str. Paraca]MBD2669779.1 hybrid sensor histidine kinase/response regulator [Arthrospira platensis FACHB-439]MBD2710360.1 hybrid sensor histidine kinase/response regulator [Arthrospira platensis FACHB-835]MDF2212628.1 hybrid sensor histidine kinase/response regulator [Arthrospira platensis NCB002]MDT9183005.1 hybrid sensor histidine kinase/response regulator [Lim
MIEDDELREVFKIASEEHLQKLDDGFLYLEQNPNDRTKIDELLREAHSLKGDAGMLGVKDVSTLAHQLEHLLGAINRGEDTFSHQMSDRMAHGLDAIRKLVKEAVTGEPSGINAFYVLANLMGARAEGEIARPTEVGTPAVADSDKSSDENLTAPTTEEGDQEEAESTPETQETETPEDSVTEGEHHPENAEPGDSPTVELEKPAPSSPTVTPISTYKIETIRVATRNLDALMTQTGELTVTKIRIAHRLAEIEEITNLLEEWSRDAFINRFALHDLEAREGLSHGRGTMGQLQSYHQRTGDRLEILSTLVNQLRTSIYEDMARLDLISDELEEGVRTLRLLPLSTIFNLFPRMVRDLAREQKKQVQLIIEGGETRADKRILEEMKDPLMHILRNAIDHGIETAAERATRAKPPQATIRLRGYQTATSVVIEVSDDGRGLDIEQIKQTAIKRGICQPEELVGMTIQQIQALIFTPGFSTRKSVTEVSGRGVGMDVVRTNVEHLKGTINVDSTSGRGSTFRIQLGTTLATAHVLIVAVDSISYAIPVEYVQTTLLVDDTDIFAIEGRDTILFDDQPVSVMCLVDLLEVKSSRNAIIGWNNHRGKSKGEGSQRETPRDMVSVRLRENLIPTEMNNEVNSNQSHQSKAKSCIILRMGENRLGLFVDSLIDEQDVVLKPQSQLLRRVRNVAGATILGTGEVCMVLNPQDMIRSVRKNWKSSTPINLSDSDELDLESDRPSVILLVEDSIATRTQEKRILEAAGYEVVTAVDGLDGLNKLKTRSFDAVISDIQMPNLDGLGLTAKIREHQEYSELPIILVTSLASDDDKRRGAEAGANAYITKGSFNQDVLLQTLSRLV